MKQKPLSEGRSEEELRQASNWLIYEIWMVKGLAKVLHETRSYAYTGTGFIWNNSEPDDGALYNAAGQLVSYWRDQE